MEKEIIIKQGIIIVAILGVAFLSQQPFFAKLGKNMASQGVAAVSGYVSKGSNWVSSNLLSKLGGEVQKGGEAITTQVNQGKENISSDSKNISTSVKNYVSGVANSIAGKNNCQPATATKSKP
jgi:hypothetical protein